MRTLASIILAGSCLVLCWACNQTAHHQGKPIPRVYKILNDPEFTNVLDTLYYKKRLFSGYQYALYPSGDTAFIKSFCAGLEEGTHRAWYQNQQLAEERYYIEGKKEGIHRAWWANGKPKFIYNFNQNEFNGINQEFYENGARFKKFHYAMGHEEGRQQLWWINGKTRANYLIKNGRRYGLLGTKNCINVSDSIAFIR